MKYNEKILHILIQKMKQQQLASFYHLELPNPAQKKAFITHWLLPFLTQTLNRPNSGLSSLINHPDLLIIGRKQQGETLERDKTTAFTLEDMEPLIQFCSLPPWSETYKITLLFDAQRMNSLISNKLLKTLEEPSPGNIIFLINMQQAPLLPTIKSRAINLRLGLFSPPPLKEENLGEQSLPQLMGQDPGHKIDEQYLQYILEKETQAPQYSRCTHLLKLTKWFMQSQALRNSHQERLARISLFDKSHQ